jgi:transposase
MIFDKRYRQALLWNSILDLRAEGLLNYEIAAVLKRSATMIATSVTRMKRAGLKVPESVYDSAQWMDSWYKLRNARGDINRHC